jgi:tRNA-2-methylthio-N6-dimethylallyladenosine synthase
MNKADSEIAAGTLLAAGFQETANPAEADIIVINTCAVRERAVERLYGYVNSLKSPFKVGKPPLLAIGGCVAEQKKDLLWKELPQTDIIFGTRAFHALPQAIERALNGDERIDLVAAPGEIPPHPPVRPDDSRRAWLPISRGCDNFCSYCVVPHTRGRETSRPLTEVLEEARLMTDRGVREITLLGQNVNSYGNDLGGANLFSTLLTSLDELPDLKRVRFMTSHPKDLSHATIQALAASSNACEYVHLPLQAGSDRVLAAMNRKYTLEQYLGRVEALRRAIPGIALSTDVIVGFPGETEAEFGETMDAVETVGFDSAYTFIYSPRPGTPAADLPDKTSWEEKEARLRRLIGLQSEMSRTANAAYIGRQVEVFLEKPSRRSAGDWTGRTRTNKTVNTPAAGNMTGQFVNVEITGAGAASLTGVLCGKTE